MTQRDENDIGAELVGDLHAKRPDLIGSGCQCSYCRSIREGTAPPVPQQQESSWLRRMGGMPAR